MVRGFGPAACLLPTSDNTMELLIPDLSNVQPEKKLLRFAWPSCQRLDSIVVHEGRGPDELGILETMGAAPFGRSADQILILNLTNRTIFQLDSGGGVVHRFLWDSEKYPNFFPQIYEKTPPLPWPGDSSQWIMPVGQSVPTSPRGLQSEVPAVIRIKLNSHSRKINILDTLLCFPPAYDAGLFGNNHYLYTPSLAWKDSNSILVSFPIDHQVYEIGLQGERLNIYPLRSKYTPAKTEPMFERNALGMLPSEVPFMDTETRFEYIWTTSYYDRIFKIPQSPYFIRSVNAQPSLSEVREARRTGKIVGGQSFIILDENLTPLNEQFFHNSRLSSYGIFYDDGGVYFIDEKKSKSEEASGIFYKGWKVKKRETD